MKIHGLRARSSGACRAPQRFGEKAPLMSDCDSGRLPARGEPSKRVVGVLTEPDVCSPAHFVRRRLGIAGTAHVVSSSPRVTCRSLAIGPPRVRRAAPSLSITFADLVEAVARVALDLEEQAVVLDYILRTRARHISLLVEMSG